MNTNELQTNNTITTLEIAEMMDLPHAKIIRKLEGDKNHIGIIPVLNEAHLGLVEYFVKSTYIDSKGEERPCYLVTKMGCDFLANKFTGEKGILFTAKYVKRFSEMEKEIHNFHTKKANLLLAIYDGGQDAVLAAKELTDLEVAEATKPLLEKIEDDKPKVDFHDAVAETTTECVDISEFSKILKKHHVDLGRNKLFRWLRENKYLMSGNVPYQNYMDRGYFQVIEVVEHNRIHLKTLITGKGQIALLKKLSLLQ